MKFLKKCGFGASALLASYFASAATKLCDPTSAAAQSSSCSVTGLESNLQQEMSAGGRIFYAGAAIIGIALVVIGLLKLKAHAMDTQGTSGHLRTAIWMLIIGALLIAVPVVMLLGANSITGNTIALPSEAGLFNS